MFVKHLQEYLEQFTVVKGKKTTGIGNARIYMQVGHHLEEIKRIEVQESNIIGQNTIRVVLKPERQKLIIAPNTPDYTALVPLKPEQKFYEKIKRKFKKFSLIRLENNSLHGTPDLLVCNDSGHFFTIELKVCKGNKIRFSPHQIAFHIKHPHNTFIMVQHLGSGSVKLFRGSRILELEACGFKLAACCLELDACRLMLADLGKA